MELGPIAVFANLDPMAPPSMAAAAQRLEALGYDTLYFPVSLAHDSLVQASMLLSATTTMNIATGIVPIYDHSPQIVAGAQRLLFDQSGGRFLLGLGVSHQAFVEGVRKVEYGPPVTNMRTFLRQLDECIAGTTASLAETVDAAKRPSITGAPMPRVIAALGPRMMELAQQTCTGAHPYLVNPEHTAQARGMLGDKTWLCVEQKVILQTDPGEARAVAREQLAIYLALPNYLNSWRLLGFDDADFLDGGSDRLIDALVAWGDEDAIRKRLDEHLAAGATQVCVQALPSTVGAASGIPWPALELVADSYGLK
jgi:probable F420-dependent oxidoreductase